MTRTRSTAASSVAARLLTPIFALATVTNLSCIHIHSDPENAPDALRVPEIKEAYQAKKAIETQTAVVKNLGNELDGIVTQVSFQVPSANAADPKARLIAAVRALRDAAREVLDKGPRYLDAIERLSTDMRAGRRSFGGASKLFETFAAEEPYEAIADDYHQIALLFAELSRRCSTAENEFIEKFDRAAFLETLQYIRHQELLLDRFEAALTAAFEDPELLEIQSLVAQINAYTKRYEAFRVQIRDLNRLVPLLEQEPSTPNSGSEHPDSDSSAPEPTPSPIAHDSGPTEGSDDPWPTPQLARSGKVASNSSQLQTIGDSSASDRNTSAMRNGPIRADADRRRSESQMVLLLPSNLPEPGRN